MVLNLSIWLIYWSWWRIILEGTWITKFGTRFEKYLLKNFTNFLLTFLIWLFHFQVTLFSRLLMFYQLGMVSRFTVFQNWVLSVTRLTSRLLKKPFLVSCSSLTWIFYYFLCATRDNIALSFLNLFNNLDRFRIAFVKFLFTNVAWLHLTCFSFHGE